MDAWLSIENMEAVTIEIPSDPPTEASRTEIRIWEKKVDDYVNRETILKENLKTTYSLVWGQCSDMMRQKVEASEGFLEVSRNGDVIELLTMIKDVAYNFQTQKYLPQALHEAKKRFFNCYQPRHQTTQAYLETFQNHLDVIKHIGGLIGTDPIILIKIAKELNKAVGELKNDEK